MAWNFVLSTPGTLAVTVRSMRVILNPSPTFSTVHAADVSMLVGVKPSFSSPALSAMLKQAASAAARSSSGLEPVWSPNRVPKLYFAVGPVSERKLPFPVLSPPVHFAVAFLVGIVSRAWVGSGRRERLTRSRHGFYLQHDGTRRRVAPAVGGASAQQIPRPWTRGKDAGLAALCEAARACT